MTSAGCLLHVFHFFLPPWYWKGINDWWRFRLTEYRPFIHYNKFFTSLNGCKERHSIPHAWLSKNSMSLIRRYPICCKNETRKKERIKTAVDVSVWSEKSPPFPSTVLYFPLTLPSLPIFKEWPWSVRWCASSVRRHLYFQTYYIRWLDSFCFSFQYK